MTISADPDQLASSEANWSGSTLFAKTEHAMFSKRRVKNWWWNLSVWPFSIWAVPYKNVSSCICRQQNPRSACASVQSDQGLHCLLTESLGTTECIRPSDTLRMHRMSTFSLDAAHLICTIFYTKYSDTLTLILLNLDTSCLNKQCRSRSVWLLKKPTDLDPHCLPLCLWIYNNNLDQVIWLAEN